MLVAPAADGLPRGHWMQVRASASLFELAAQSTQPVSVIVEPVAHGAEIVYFLVKHKEIFCPYVCIRCITSDITSDIAEIALKLYNFKSQTQGNILLTVSKSNVIGMHI